MNKVKTKWINPFRNSSTWLMHCSDGSAIRDIIAGITFSTCKSL